MVNILTPNAVREEQSRTYTRQMSRIQREVGAVLPPSERAAYTDDLLNK